MVKHLKKILLLLALVSCKSEFQSFRERALALARNDNRIDENEYKTLLSEISESSEKGFQQFKRDGDQINDSTVASYLRTYFSNEKLNLSVDDIWQPFSSSVKEGFNINVFLENSGSMNGYLNDPNTQFKNSVYSLLTRLKLVANQDSLNLCFINKKDQLVFRNATNNDVEFFKNILNPSSFSKISSGQTGDTDINELIKRCLNKVNKNNCSVFISDCIYSPGKKHPDASMYLAEQKSGIFLNVATEIRNRNSDLSILILQLNGGFKGDYYDKQNNVTEIKKPVQRPFYIWFFGTNNQIDLLIKSGKLEELDGGYVNKLLFQVPLNTVPSYKILYSSKIGNFSPRELNQKIILDASPSNKGQQGVFGFNVAVDFSTSSRGLDYYSDSTNYKCNSSYNLQVEQTNETNFTHLLKLKTTDLRSENLDIKVIAKNPRWIYDYSSIDDSDIKDNIDEQRKTFGFRFLIEGISDAFYPKSNSNIINRITITIKKEK